MGDFMENDHSYILLPGISKEFISLDELISVSDETHVLHRPRGEIGAEYLVKLGEWVVAGEELFVVLNATL